MSAGAPISSTTSGPLSAASGSAEGMQDVMHAQVMARRQRAALKDWDMAWPWSA